MNVHPKLFWLFFFALFIPTTIGIRLGSLRLSLYRIALLIFFLISAKFILVACKPGKKNPSFYLLAYGLWAALSLAINHGFSETLETSGIYLIETIGPFLIALAYCTTAKRITKVIELYILVICLSLVITIPESLTGINWIKKLIDPIFHTPYENIGRRMGLYRAAGSFDHPILQGLVAGTAVGFAWFYYKKISRVILVVAAAVTSVSSGAIVAIYIQAMLIGWEKTTKNLKSRWGIFIGLILLIYFTIDVISNRSAMRAILSNLTMSPHTAYWRLLIWDFGLQNANEHPIFGMGFHDWVRPRWMYSGSMDAFWLVSMVRYGYVGFLFYATAIGITMYRLFFLKLKNPKLIAIRRGWLTGMVGIIISCCTVHLWNNAYVFFNFYLGLGAAIYISFSKEQKKLDLESSNNLDTKVEAN